MIEKSAVFILPVISQPRYLKRIQALKADGYNCTIFSFEREYFKGNNLEEFISLGRVQHGNYLKRSKILIKAFLKLLRNRVTIKNANYLYVFGLDNLVLINLLVKLLNADIKIIYEVADIRDAMFQTNMLGKTLRLVEKNMIEKTYLTVVTSPYFISDYFVPLLNVRSDKFLVIENKLFNPIPELIEKEHENNKLRIGFFGLLRSQKAWELLYNLAAKHPNYIEIYIRGYLLNLGDFEKKINELDNIKYDGEYKSPDDLAEMYGRIDISLIGNISNNMKNVNLALPNRYYESLHYRTPMIAHSNTAVARKIKQNAVGWEIDFTELDTAIEKIMSINSDELKKVKEKTYVDKNLTVGDYDHQILLNRIKKEY